MDTDKIKHLKYSVLDLAIVTEGNSAATAINQSRKIAQAADKLNYHRFWMAEHHNMETIASSATSVLLGHMAEATKNIRIGAGGVMLPNHSPLIIAEHYGTLATMYPDRIDLGLGRAPGTDQTTAQAIRSDREEAVRKFPQNVIKLRNYFSSQNQNSKVRAIPGEGTDIPLYILGSSTDSAHLAAALGLPYVFASHFAPQKLKAALSIYRKEFKPSTQLEEPYVIACANIIAADTNDHAEYLSTSLKQMFIGIITNDRSPMPPPIDDLDRIWNMRLEMAVRQMLEYTYIGDKNTIKKGVEEFINATDADEIMIASYIYDLNARIDSHKIFAEAIEELKSEG